MIHLANIHDDIELSATHPVSLSDLITVKEESVEEQPHISENVATNKYFSNENGKNYYRK